MSDLEQLLAASEERPGASAMLQIQDAAGALVLEDRQKAVQELLPGPFAFTRGWFQAALLERLGRREEALAVLETLPEPTWGDPRALWLLTRARLTVESGGRPQALLRHATRAAASYRLLRQIDMVWRQGGERGGGGGTRRRTSAT